MTPEGYHSAYYNIFISPYGEWTYACPLVGQWLVDCLFDSAGVSVGVVHANIRLVRVRIVIIVVLTNAFNIDTHAPIFKIGPTGSYFGFSVAEHFNGEQPVAAELVTILIMLYELVGSSSFDTVCI
uniref:Uncharacterized protein n=1 Tax=Ascaris lumbricoides TaxID=6252 RepID=A0A0M3HXD8_ASCLU